MSIPCSDHKITSAVWGPLGEFVIAGHENGEINQISAKVGHMLAANMLGVAGGNVQKQEIPPSVNVNKNIAAM